MRTTSPARAGITCARDEIAVRCRAPDLTFSGSYRPYIVPTRLNVLMGSFSSVGKWNIEKFAYEIEIGDLSVIHSINGI